MVDGFIVMVVKGFVHFIYWIVVRLFLASVLYVLFNYLWIFVTLTVVTVLLVWWYRRSNLVSNRDGARGNARR
jgi:hypothetical protein